MASTSIGQAPSISLVANRLSGLVREKENALHLPMLILGPQAPSDQTSDAAHLNPVNHAVE